MKFKLTAFLLVFSITSLLAQEKKWTLQECIAYAEENNISIEQFELNLENAKIDESDAFGNFLPDANAQISTSASTGLSLIRLPRTGYYNHYYR